MIFEETIHNIVLEPTIMKRTIYGPCVISHYEMEQVEFVGVQNYSGQTNTVTTEIGYAGTNDYEDGITKS